jgi:hypothetical protein
MAFDLSAGDNASVIAWHPHEDDNQQVRALSRASNFHSQKKKTEWLICFC